MRPFLFITFLIAGCFTAMPQTNQPPKMSPAEMMRAMRLKQLTMLPSEFGEKPTAEFPHVCGVLMDWPIDANTVTFTVTVVARDTGDASIYTTGTFGVIGGIGHENVRNVAKSCVKVANKHFEDASPTKDYPYPKTGRVRFYLVGYDGVRVIERDLGPLRKGNDKCSDLYEAAQRVVTELRLIALEPKGEKR